MIDLNHRWTVSFKPQFLGFVFSLLLIVAIYRIVTHHDFPNSLLTITVVSFCTLQALIQLFFFLHVGLESKPHWPTITFLFTLLVIFIVIGGSLWIMNNLNYNLMPPMEHTM